MAMQMAMLTAGRCLFTASREAMASPVIYHLALLAILMPKQLCLILAPISVFWIVLN